MATVSGSSPHARGALPECLGEVLRLGIIPACAGSASSRSFLSWRFRDHPRMRGEHRFQRRRPIRRPGSSPHARGAQVGQLHWEDGGGIIPACAGSTAGRSWS